MANLKVIIVVRTKDAGGNRNWVIANGKTDPPGPLYLRWYERSMHRHTKAGNSFDEAELAQMRLERKLKAQSQGFVLRDETPGQKFHSIPEVMMAYLADLRLNRRPERSIRSKKSELEEFAKFCGKVCVEQISRADLVSYRNHLLDAGRADVTVLNKLMSVSTWLKKNPDC